MKTQAPFAILQAMGLNPANPLPASAQTLRLQVLAEAQNFRMQAGQTQTGPVLRPSHNRRPLSFRHAPQLRPTLLRPNQGGPESLLPRKSASWIRGITQTQDNMPNTGDKPENAGMLWHRRGQEVSGVIARRLQEEEAQKRKRDRRKLHPTPLLRPMARRPQFRPAQPAVQQAMGQQPMMRPAMAAPSPSPR